MLKEDVFLMDKSARKNIPTSKFITSKEFKRLFPEHTARGLNFVFHYEFPINMREFMLKKMPGLATNAGKIVAKFMTEKYPDEVIMVDKELNPINYLLKMKMGELQKYAMRHKVDIENLELKQDILIQEILKAQHAGVTPMTDEELAEYKEELRLKRAEAKKSSETPVESDIDVEAELALLNGEDLVEAHNAAVKLALSCDSDDIKLYDWNKILELFGLDRKIRKKELKVADCKQKAKEIVAEQENVLL